MELTDYLKKVIDENAEGINAFSKSVEKLLNSYDHIVNGFNEQFTKFTKNNDNQEPIWEKKGDEIKISMPFNKEIDHMVSNFEGDKLVIKNERNLPDGKETIINEYAFPKEFKQDPVVNLDDENGNIILLFKKVATENVEQEQWEDKKYHVTAPVHIHAQRPGMEEEKPKAKKMPPRDAKGHFISTKKKDLMA
jgi:hypothetical protein